MVSGLVPTTVQCTNSDYVFYLHVFGVSDLNDSILICMSLFRLLCRTNVWAAVYEMILKIYGIFLSMIGDDETRWFCIFDL